MTTSKAYGAARTHAGQVVETGRMPVVDVFRGLAAVLMVVNHVGVSFYAGTAGQPMGMWSMLIHLGSYAPVLFFTCTGIGYGLSSPERPVVWRDVLLKVTLLLLADNLLVQQAGGVFGLDFFGFTALAMLFLALLRSVRRPVATASLLIVLLLGLRFAVGPWFSPRAEPGTFLQWVMGFSHVNGVSYPLSPWLIYPLTGFCLARLSTDVRWRNGPVVRGVVLLVLGVSTVVTAWLVWRGAPYHRWGTMSLLYFLSSLIVMVLGYVASTAITSSERCGGRLRLDGIASFLVVPVHYALISVLHAVGVPRLQEGWYFLALMVFMVLLALIMSSRVSKAIAQHSSTSRSGFCLPLVAVVLVVSIVLAHELIFVPKTLLAIWFFPSMVCIAMALQIRLSQRIFA